MALNPRPPPPLHPNNLHRQELHPAEPGRSRPQVVDLVRGAASEHIEGCLQRSTTVCLHPVRHHRSFDPRVDRRRLDSDVTPDRDPVVKRFQHDAMTAPLQFDHQCEYREEIPERWRGIRQDRGHRLRALPVGHEHEVYRRQAARSGLTLDEHQIRTAGIHT